MRLSLQIVCHLIGVVVLIVPTELIRHATNGLDKLYYKSIFCVALLWTYVQNYSTKFAVIHSKKHINCLMLDKTKTIKAKIDFCDPMQQKNVELIIWKW